MTWVCFNIGTLKIPCFINLYHQFVHSRILTNDHFVAIARFQMYPMVSILSAIPCCQEHQKELWERQAAATIQPSQLSLPAGQENQDRARLHPSSIKFQELVGNGWRM
jgi:hypothetical protein